MKRIFTALFTTLFVPAAFAGLSYQFQSVTEGVQNATIAGTASIEAPNFRLELSSGDGLLFKKGAVILSRDGGSTLIVADPDTKSFYELRFNDLLGGPNSIIGQLGGLVDLSVANEKVGVRDGGDGGTIEGYPTRRSIIDSSYDINIDAMGRKMTIAVKMSSESWTTDKIEASYTNFLQARGLRTGVPAIDKLIDAQSGKITGFPLKQITTMRITHGGAGDMTSKTTTTVTGITRKPIAVAAFELPPGLTRKPSPLEKLLNPMQ